MNEKLFNEKFHHIMKNFYHYFKTITEVTDFDAVKRLKEEIHDLCENSYNEGYDHGQEDGKKELAIWNKSY